jgi:glycosyltransferase involved in cell wall biosynthesis
MIAKNRNIHTMYIEKNSINAKIIDHVESMEELANWYRIADAFLFPSLFEGFGRTPVEAQASGCPVITTGAAGISEVIGDSAYILDNPSDASELATSIEHLI